MFFSGTSKLLFFIRFFALALSTRTISTFAAPIVAKPNLRWIQSGQPVRREFVAIRRNPDGSIGLAHVAPSDGLYTTYNETHAEYHGNDNLVIDDTREDFSAFSYKLFNIPFYRQPRSAEPFNLLRRNSKRQFEDSCQAQCGSKSANPADITAAEAALDAQFSSAQYGLSWGPGTSIGTNGSVFQVVNNVYAYGCDLGGRGQTTTSEDYAFQVQCLVESCGSYMGSNRDKKSKAAFGRDLGSFSCN
ncbi:hypothetical protein F5890DRAFT_1541474 [Lentinula detonsa]|uniref:Uncharacterized protein n=1 Tax=Lentinula detonsa TaxID=2804962 RepID=A0AA38PRI1_9AGAR|nr:hypothetical protein F5890DRAFT_1541474 [Lentinula detonsa]